MRQTRHENTVLFMAYILDPPKDMCIVMHWCPGTLYKRLHVKREELSLPEAIRIAKETAQVNKKFKYIIVNKFKYRIRVWSIYIQNAKLFIET